MSLSPTYFTPEQRAILDLPLNTRIFLQGPAGCGKTSVGVERALQLLLNGVSGSQILLLVPQRTLATPYRAALQRPSAPASTSVEALTIGGLARRSVELFWPLITEQTPFAHPNHPPTFLTLESAQYYMAHLVRPLLAEGYFDSLTLDRNRIYSQILDNLNKAAAVGFSHSEIAARLKAAWVGEPTQARIYDDTQTCANRFREFCFAHNLLDFSLQLELFRHFLWPEPRYRRYLRQTYRHLIFDNLEEDIPLSGDLLEEWLPDFDSALLIYDEDGGYRQFLSADPERNYALKAQCEIQTRLAEGFVTSEGIATFGAALATALAPPESPIPEAPLPPAESPLPIYHSPFDTRYHPEMLDWVAAEIARLVAEGTPPGEIVVLAPYLSDSLRYSLATRIQRAGIPTRAHRPSRALREEPAAQCLLTLASLAHPQWGLPPLPSDLAYALMQAIEGLDLVRAQLLVEIIYRKGELASFYSLETDAQERITYYFGERYETLRGWLLDSLAAPPQALDHFLARLFGEVLSQPGFGFHTNYNAAAVAANLVESVRKFRWATGEALAAEGVDLGCEYALMVQDGVIAAQYLGSWADAPEDAVYLAPAYTFLMANRPVSVQFWLDVGGRGWYERLYQPLTHPYVLSRAWIAGSPWSDAEEFAASRAGLRRLALGLTRRCREAIYLGLSGVNEQGYEHKGELLRAVDAALRMTASNP